ncbi:hypothetical protein [Streptomyces albogriseolus]|uniref:hypothetical protein n=1 Tax=Streptomyces albogriseolus TaxID=1887 RepID=UPI00369C2BAA
MVDLSELFGEGWCVTLTQLARAQALERMGVRDVTDVDDGMQLATERLEADGMPATRSPTTSGTSRRSPTTRNTPP